MDQVYLFRINCFKLTQLRFSLDTFKAGDTHIPMFIFQKGEVLTRELSYEDVKREIRLTQNKIKVEETRLERELQSCWQNLGRFAKNTETEEYKTAIIDKAQDVLGFFLVMLGLIPAIRVYTAADPECISLVHAIDASVVQGLPRHGPVTDRPHPPLLHTQTWDCGSNGRSMLIVSDITCNLMCQTGYRAVYGNSYCRNLGGAGTEFTHLLTKDGLPQTSTPLDAPGCCIFDSTAATLTNFEVTLNKETKTWGVEWAADDGFPHACGSLPEVHAEICVVADSASAPWADELKCNQVCVGFSDVPPAPSTAAKCFSGAVANVGNTNWAAADELHALQLARFSKGLATGNASDAVPSLADYNAVLQLAVFGVAPSGLPSASECLRPSTKTAQ